MEDAVLKVLEREETGKKSRQNGFIPGVLYGKGLETMSVQFEASEVRKVVAHHGQRARIQLLIGDQPKMGLMKSLDRNHLGNKIVHVDIQVIDKNTITRVSVPIIYHGRNILEFNKKLLQVNASDIELICESQFLTDSIEVDVENMEVGHRITVADLNLASEIKTSLSQDTVLATISAIRELDMEEEGVDATEPVDGATESVEE